jgi:hypothetical protein
MTIGGSIMTSPKAVKIGSAALPFLLAGFWLQGGVIYGRAGTRVVREENPELFYSCCGLVALLGLVLVGYAFKK